MGNVISSRAAAANIEADVHESYLKAVAKGGKWQELAADQLAPTVLFVDTVGLQASDARKVALPLTLAQEAAQERANKVIGKVADDVWNAVGRPGHDPALDILFPGGTSFYVDGDVARQPGRIALLIELLKADLHPKLPATVAQACVDMLKTEADTLQQAVQAAEGPRTKVILMDRVRQAVARSAALQLAAFKRMLKAAGFTEAEIHTVIPDRGRPAPAKKPAAAALPALPPAALPPG